MKQAATKVLLDYMFSICPYCQNKNIIYIDNRSIKENVFCKHFLGRTYNGDSIFTK